MEFFELGDLTLASGETLPDARLAYQTFGELNAAGDNAIVFPTFLGAPAEVLNGWIGEGRALDPSRYFIVLPGHFGLAPSSAPSTAAAPANGAQFPTVSIVDDVVAQRRLVESLGVRSIALVLGWSVGGLQVYEWAARYPDMVRAFAGIATAPTPPPWTKLWLKTVVEDPIKADPKWAGGSYASAADVKAGMTGVAHGSALTAPPRAFYFGSNEGWRGLGFGSVDEFVAGFWEGFWVPQDPNDTLVQARKARTAYPGPANEELRDILGRIKPRATVAAFTGDQLFPPAESKLLADWLGVDFHEIDTPFGHLATFALSEADVKAIDGVIRTALGD